MAPRPDATTTTRHGGLRHDERHQWEAPAPVAGWVARDVVRHLTDWLPGFLRAGAGIDLARGPAVSDDPVGCWQIQYDPRVPVPDDADMQAKLLGTIGRDPFWTPPRNPVIDGS